MKNYPHSNRRRRSSHPAPVRSAAVAGEDGAKINFADIFETLRYGKWIIIASFVLVTGLVGILTWLTPSEYESHSIVYVDTSSSSSNAPFSSIGVGIEDRGLYNELGILQYSVPLAERVAERLIELAPHTESRESLPVTEYLGNPETELAKVTGYLMGRARFGLVSTNMNMVRITAVSESAEEAALIANLYAEEYYNRSRETSRSNISAIRDFLTEQEQRRREEVQDIEQRYEAFVRQHGVLMLGAEGENLVSRVARMDAQREEALIDLEMTRTSLNLLEQQAEQIKPGLADRIASGVGTQVQTLQSRIADLNLRIEEFYANTPSLRGNESQSQELARLVEQRDRYREELRTQSTQLADDFANIGLGIDPAEGGQSLAHISQLNRQIVDQRVQMGATQALVNELTDRIRQNESRLNTIPGQSVQLAQLERERQAAIRMHSQLVDRLQETVIAEESELGYVQIIRNATVPFLPVRPNAKQNLILGMLLGLLFGAGLAFVRRSIGQRIFKPEDLKDHGYELIGIVPKMDRAIKDVFGGKKVIEVSGRRINSKLIPIHDQWSPIAEAYRYIRTNIQFGRPDKVIQTLMVTSANAGEGKTLTSLNLAVTMAQSGRRTLYVDADLRQPTGHLNMDVDREPGLVELLSQDKKYSWGDFATPVDNLYLVPSGNVTGNAAEIIGSKEMRDFVLRLRDVFDVIVFDVPPILPVADGVLLSTQCDGVILLAAAGQTDLRALDQAYAALDTVGAKVIGAVLNSFDGKSGYGYGYAYGTGYGDSTYGYGYGPRRASAQQDKYSRA